MHGFSLIAALSDWQRQGRSSLFSTDRYAIQIRRRTPFNPQISKVH